MSKKLSTESRIRTKLRELSEAGVSPNAIGKACDVAHTTVARLIRDSKAGMNLDTAEKLVPYLFGKEYSLTIFKEDSIQ